MFKYIRNESGQSMVLVALMLIVLLGFGALAVDVGAMTFQRSKLQNAADAAALAGALAAGNSSNDDIVKGKAENYAVLNFKDDDTTTITPVINRANKTVEVTIEQDIPKYLSGVISKDTSRMNVKAVAKYNVRWGGLALPLVNTGYVYTDKEEDGEYTDIILRINTTPGDKSQIFDFDTVIDEFGLKRYYVDYGDGVEVDQGNGNTFSNIDNTSLKTAVNEILKGVEVGDKFYLLTVRDDLIEGFYNGIPVSVTNKGEKKGRTSDNGGFHQHDIIDPEALVLIEVEYIWHKTANDTEIKMKFTGNEYDVMNGELPPEYPGNVNKVTSVLIE